MLKQALPGFPPGSAFYFRYAEKRGPSLKRRRNGAMMNNDREKKK